MSNGACQSHLRPSQVISESDEGLSNSLQVQFTIRDRRDNIKILICYPLQKSKVGVNLKATPVRNELDTETAMLVVWSIIALGVNDLLFCSFQFCEGSMNWRIDSTTGTSKT